MSKRVNIGYNFDLDAQEKSECECDRLEVRVVVRDSYESTVKDVDWFVDVDNGLVVANVADYEKWLTQNRLEREVQ